jgi:hypothetical protein
MAKTKTAQATSAAPPVAKATAAKWTTVTVTAATPPFSPNRAHPMDVAHDAAKLSGIAILKTAGKADKQYVRCADGTVRSAKSPLAVEALAAHASAGS